MKYIKVVIIDHSSSFCTSFSQQFKNEEIQVVGTTQQSDHVIELVKSTNPHVILLDVMLLSEAILRELTQVIKVPVIILSDGSVNQTAKTIYAISIGAVDFIVKESKENDKEKYKIEIMNKIKSAQKSKRIRTFKNKKQVQCHPQKNTVVRIDHRKINVKNSIIAIGTSTGGPRALQKVLQILPVDFPVPILIVQHMPSGFTKSLAERLNNICKIKVKEAEDGELIKRGTAYIAPGNYHMKVREAVDNFRIVLSQEAERSGHRPSVNTLFESIALIENIHKIIVVLTGMGKDGAEGIRRIKELEEDAVIIVESKETAIINGMPNAAIETNYVTEILALDHIGQALIDYSKNRGT